MIGYLIKVDISTKLVKITKVVYPNQTPNINGIVFFIPKLKPEYEATALFGPGVKPKDNEIPINKNSSGCIKRLSYRKTILRLLRWMNQYNLSLFIN